MRGNLFWQVLTFALSALTMASALKGSPGLSASLDYSDFETMREPMTEAVLQAINNLDVPDITFTGGYMKNNKLYVDQDSMNLYFEPVEEENSLIF